MSDPFTLRLEGEEREIKKEGGLFKDEPNYWDKFHRLVAELGHEGWEIVNVDSFNDNFQRAGVTYAWHLWFKCPKQ